MRNVIMLCFIAFPLAYIMTDINVITSDSERKLRPSSATIIYTSHPFGPKVDTTTTPRPFTSNSRRRKQFCEAAVVLVASGVTVRAA